MPAAGRFLIVAVVVAAVLGLSGAAAEAQTVTVVPATTSPGVTGAPSVATALPAAGDDSSTRTVDRIVAVLIAFAVVLIAVAIWFWRATKPAPRHLDALDAMTGRAWQEGTPESRSHMLAAVHERRGEIRYEDLVVAASEDGAADEAVPVGEATVGQAADDASALEASPAPPTAEDVSADEPDVVAANGDETGEPSVPHAS